MRTTMNEYKPYQSSNASTKLAHAALFIVALVVVTGLTQFVYPPFDDKATEVSFTMENTSYAFPINEQK